MPTILLIRHGENEYTRTGKLAGRLPGVHLNDPGRQQAEAVAAALKDAPIKAIYSSPLERTMDTAQPLADALKLPINKRPGLLESDLGNWQGQSLKRLSRLKAWGQLQHHPSRFAFPGGESMLAQQARLVGEIEAIVAGHKPKDLIACFSHSDPIKLILAHYIGLPLDKFQRLAIDTASISVLALSENSAYLVKLNAQAKEIGKLAV